MSILIDDMDMPKNCVDCKLRDFSILGTYCIITHKPVFADKYENERHENCPLVEVPTPHGDLIDRDKLLKHQQRLCKKCGRGICPEYCPSLQAINDIKSAKTVFESEGKS